ncbi:MAG TPA: TIM barrel protein [Spirochaetia bacterium]|nr:TIM barrel protein [Spirochaetia bacterium]
MRLGIGSYTFTWAVGVSGHEAPRVPIGAESLVREGRRLGVSVVQVGDNLPLHEMPPARLETLAKEARSAGISLEVGTRGTDPAHLRKYLAIAAVLGARLVRSMVSGSIEDADRDLRAVVPDYERAGVVLALENYEKHPAAALAGLVKRLASPSLGVCLDTVNSLGALEPPGEVLASLLTHTVCLHVKDFDIVRADHRMGFSVIGAPAGRGMLDVPALLGAARREARDPNAILELWTPYVGSVEATVQKEREWAEESIRELRRYVES